MLRAYNARVSDAAAAGLHDPDRPIPFANVEWPKRRYKRHGIKGAKQPRTRGGHSVRSPGPDARRPRGPASPSVVEAVAHRTQRVTEADMRGGQIRIPRGSTKRLFPIERANVELELRGEACSVRWNPRYGPDRERSGVLRVGAERLARLVRADEVLRVARVGGVLRLD